MSWGTFILLKVSFSEKLRFISHLGLSWSSEVLGSYFFMPKKWLPQYFVGKTHIQVHHEAFTAMPRESVVQWTHLASGYKYNRRMSWKCQANFFQQVSAHNGVLQVIEKNESIKNWDENYFMTSELEKLTLCIINNMFSLPHVSVYLDPLKTNFNNSTCIQRIMSK